MAKEKQNHVVPDPFPYSKIRDEILKDIRKLTQYPEELFGAEDSLDNLRILLLVHRQHGWKIPIKYKKNQEAEVHVPFDSFVKIERQLLRKGKQLLKEEEFSQPHPLGEIMEDGLEPDRKGMLYLRPGKLKEEPKLEIRYKRIEPGCYT